MITGIAYPLQLDSSGSLKLASGSDYIGQQILSYLETELGERLGLPNYGLPDFLLKSQTAPGFIAADIEAKLPLFIPQATFQVQANLSDDGELEIQIFWNYQGEEQAPISTTFTV